jgi:acyl carrier protein
MARPAVLARVLELAGRLPGARRPPEVPGPDTPLADGGFWLDSVGLLELIVACEEAFGICVDPADLTPERLGSAGGLAALIESRMTAPRVTAGE